MLPPRLGLQRTAVPGSVSVGCVSPLTLPQPSCSSWLSLSSVPASDPSSPCHPLPSIMRQIRWDRQILPERSLLPPSSSTSVRPLTRRALAKGVLAASAVASATDVLCWQCSCLWSFCPMARPCHTSRSLFPSFLRLCGHPVFLPCDPAQNSPPPATGPRLPESVSRLGVPQPSMCLGSCTCHCSERATHFLRVLLLPGWVAEGSSEGGASESFLKSHVGS